MSELPKGWRSVRLMDAGIWLSGGTPPTNEPRYWDGDIPWISAASLKNFRISNSDRRVTQAGAEAGTRRILKGAVLFVVRGMSLKNEFRVGVTQRELTFGQDCKAIVPRPEIDSTFLALALKARTPQILSMVDEAGHGTGRLPTDLISRLVIGVPPLAEQRRITEIFNGLDELIETTKQGGRKISSIKQGFLEDVSVRSFQEDLIPLQRCAQLITSGSRGWASYYADDGALFIRIGNLTRRHLNLQLSDRVFVRPPQGNEGERTLVHPGDVLISITADLGVIGIAPQSLGEAYVNQHIALVRLNPDVNSRWVGYMLASNRGQAQFTLLNDAGAKAGLNLPAVGRLQMPLPSRPAQDRIVAMLDNYEQQVANYERELAKLQLLRQGLMDDLLTGRTRVPVQ
jgi:type I restriction enzyme S subunit